ncbi:23S rRNA (adenine2503-C2)-methyltransferase [Sporobacter termitidis DSM 10068]|uniref:23S rRNA (Adenine2503-C2)-methyltransferase n=1 Tax=Sporobacter termitidis DSM 10068 TaxID=1123282 RepID=A0A1M5XRR2_9FIRM|nr:radical SAM protein [Sporobacter termitidis]SHI02446.1 23S rRNA (adenine2503-C2)-methyltransferase [Sporobacter termitidis DSM 10068]
MKILNQIAGGDGAAKFLLGLEDAHTVETLYMHDKELSLTYHSTVCVSSQVGCAVGCRFCATGAQGFIRDLSAEEIFGQVAVCDRYRAGAGCPPIDAVVFAGMGEPLFNDGNVTRAIEKIAGETDIRGFELATAGIVPKIRGLTGFVREKNIRLRLNLSLHATTDEQRALLIPMTKKYGVKAILDAASDFAEATGTTARVRYMLIKGVNDSDADIGRLTGLLKGRPLKLIISSYNDNNMNGLSPVGPLDVLEFYSKIRDNVDCDIFHNFGGEVLGGCGQLRQARKIS